MSYSVGSLIAESGTDGAVFSRRRRRRAVWAHSITTPHPRFVPLAI